MEEAERRIEEALAVAVPLAEAHPGDLLCRRWLGRSREVCGDIFVRMDQLAKAELEYRAAVTIMDGVYREYPGRPDMESLYLRYRINLGTVLARLGNFADAEKELRVVLTTLGPAADAPEFAPLHHETTSGQWSQYAVDAQNDIYLAATCLARCAALAEKDEKLTAARRQQLAQMYGTRPLELLSQAVANGFHDVEMLKKTSAWEALRSQPRFQELVTDREAKGRKQQASSSKD